MSSFGNSAIEKLITGCVKSDRKCQQKIYELYYSKMMGVCIRYSNNREEAKDLLHDGFLKVFNNINKFDHKGSFEGWVRKIMINTTIDNFRKSKPIYLKDENELLNIEDSESDLNILSRLSLEDILKAVQNLSPAYRAVFNLYVIEGYTHKEVANELGISVGTSKSNLAKAKYNLRKIFTKVVEK
ncbi:MAG: sigma-70 family RNA polymerase sigma factor [Bacteroidota bacterium]